MDESRRASFVRGREQFPAIEVPLSPAAASRKRSVREGAVFPVPTPYRATLCLGRAGELDSAVKGLGS